MWELDKLNSSSTKKVDSKTKWRTTVSDSFGRKTHSHWGSKVELNLNYSRFEEINPEAIKNCILLVGEATAATQKGI